MEEFFNLIKYQKITIEDIIRLRDRCGWRRIRPRLRRIRKGEVIRLVDRFNYYPKDIHIEDIIRLRDRHRWKRIRPRQRKIRREEVIRFVDKVYKKEIKKMIL